MLLVGEDGAMLCLMHFGMRHVLASRAVSTLGGPLDRHVLAVFACLALKCSFLILEVARCAVEAKDTPCGRLKFAARTNVAYTVYRVLIVARFACGVRTLAHNDLTLCSSLYTGILALGTPLACCCTLAVLKLSRRT